MLFFSKKLPDDILIQNFWDWFGSYRKTIEAYFVHETGDMQDVINAVDREIIKATPLCKRERRFEFGGKAPNWELFVFHLGDGYLKKCVVRMMELMPEDLKKTWTMRTGK